MIRCQTLHARVVQNLRALAWEAMVPIQRTNWTVPEMLARLYKYKSE